MTFEQLTDSEAFWLTLYGEARGEPIEGQIGVANVIRNRSIESKKSYKDICLAPSQFSCWLPYDPNRKILEELADRDFHNGGSINDSQVVYQLKAITEMIMTNRFMDNTKGANHYLEINLFKDNPPLWAKQGDVKIQLGHHMFLWCK